MMAFLFKTKKRRLLSRSLFNKFNSKTFLKAMILSFWTCTKTSKTIKKWLTESTKFQESPGQQLFLPILQNSPYSKSTDRLEESNQNKNKTIIKNKCLFCKHNPPKIDIVITAERMCLIYPLNSPGKSTFLVLLNKKIAALAIQSLLWKCSKQESKLNTDKMLSSQHNMF